MISGKKIEIACLKVENVPVSKKVTGATRYWGAFVMFCINTKDCKNPGWVQQLQCKDTEVRDGVTRTLLDQTVFALDDLTGATNVNPSSGPTFNEAGPKKFCFIDVPGFFKLDPEVTLKTTECKFRTSLICDTKTCGVIEWSMKLELTASEGTVTVKAFDLPAKKIVNKGAEGYDQKLLELNATIKKPHRFKE